MGRPEPQGQVASGWMQPTNAGITCQAWPTHGTVLQMRLLGGTNCPAHAWESVGLPLASTHLHGHSHVSYTRPRGRLRQQTVLQQDQEGTFAGIQWVAAGACELSRQLLLSKAGSHWTERVELPVLHFSEQGVQSPTEKTAPPHAGPVQVCESAAPASGHDAVVCGSRLSRSEPASTILTCQ